ncbi:MAG: hypothetical protein OEX07_12975 [Gammaproteobacteria bacterium]|nr:hypothetical protein [Gammaproteobacteria bacterium]
MKSEMEESIVIERDISLDEVISNTHFVSEEETENSVPTDESFYGNYVCTLVCDNNAYFITHPSDHNKVLQLHQATIEIRPEFNAKKVLVVFDNGNINKPVVTGVINSVSSKNIKDKKENIVFEADKEIVLKCGKSSITLTRAGKVLIRGAYLLSRSSGANRIKGGSVHLN